MQIDIINQEPNQLSWKEVLNGEKEAPYFRELMKHIEDQRIAGKLIYPKNSEIFNALTLTPFEKVKVVIIGQDPYHGPNQAHGLSFSVKKGIPFPPSLQNIFKEIKDEIGISQPSHGCLECWALQGVLLLNTVLTVEQGKPGSHANLGWERFTDRIILELNSRKSELVFLLWGAHAQKKCQGIDRIRHLVLTSPHPSPFSAARGFFGNKHFLKTNQYLVSLGKEPINWSII